MSRCLGFVPAVSAILCLLTFAAMAQPGKHTKAEQQKNPPSRPAPHSPPARQSQPRGEISRDAILKELQRRDREQQDERDRDDLG